MTPFELWLPLGAAGFYLYDSAQLLWHNELVFRFDGRRWRFDAGTDVRLFGRRVHLPNPFQPQHLQFRVLWSDQPTTGIPGPKAEFTKLHGTLAGVRIPVLLMALVLLVVLPAVTWTLGAGLTVLGVFAGFYLLIFVALGFVHRHGTALSCRGKPFAALCFDALACAPFAANLVRKLCARQALTDDALAFARTHFDAATLARLMALVRARIDEELRTLPADSARAARLRLQRTTLEGAPS